MKKEYKLETGLRSVKAKSREDRANYMFNSVMDAWNSLRNIIPNKYATLYEKNIISVPINNHHSVIARNNAKYEKKMPDSMYQEDWYWKPVLYGITSDEYKIG